MTAPSPIARPRPRAASAHLVVTVPPAAAARRAADRHRPVRDGDGVPSEEIQPRPGEHAGRSAVLQARHHRLELRARRGEPADHPRPRRQSRAASQENGIGAGGVSDLGEDHSCRSIRWRREQVEVIRGPATLRYGSQAIGGVVNVDQQPHSRPRCRCGAPCARFEIRGAVTSVDNGIEGGVLLDAGAGNFAFHADAYRPQRRRLPHPGYPYLSRPTARRSTAAAEFLRRAPTARRSAARIFSTGLRRRRDHAEQQPLRIPGIDGEDAPARASTRADQGDRQGRVPPAVGRRSTRCGSGSATPTTSTTRSALPIRSTRRPTACARPSPTRSTKAASKCSSLPFDLRFAALTTALGVQARPAEADRAGRRPGPLSGLFDPNENTRVAGYIFNEFKFTERDQGADRRPHRARAGSTARRRTFPPISCPTGNAARCRCNARAQLHAEERQRRPAPGPAVGSRRQRHRATCRARAEAGRAVLARAARRDRDVRHRQSQSRRSKSPSRSRSACGAPKARCGSRPPPTTRGSTASSSAASPA